jgi:23S rRNA pseudouridine1911/1915/1917 synthase
MKGKSSTTLLTIDQPGQLLATLVARLPNKSRKLLKVVLRDRQVKVDGQTIGQFDHPLSPGQKVEILWQPQEQKQPRHGVEIVFEDDDIIIVNKPAGLLTIATDKEKRKTAYAVLSSHVKQADPEAKIFIIHRLDRETSGLLMFAKSEQIKQQIQKSWDATIRQRTYVAVVSGRMEQMQGKVVSWLTESSALKVYSSQNPQQGRKAVTNYRVKDRNNSYSLLEVNLDTGRKHQIRVHLQDLGHPVIGDKKYGSGDNPIGRLGLHARVLAFSHPRTGNLCRFSSEIPPAFSKLFANKKSEMKRESTPRKS